jgi:hypothetical protein
MKKKDASSTDKAPVRPAPEPDTEAKAIAARNAEYRRLKADVTGRPDWWEHVGWAYLNVHGKLVAEGAPDLYRRFSLAVAGILSDPESAIERLTIELETRRYGQPLGPGPGDRPQSKPRGSGFTVIEGGRPPA